MVIKVVSIISRMNVGGPSLLISELVQNLPGPEFDHTLITGVCADNEIDYLKNHPLDSEVIYLNRIGRSVALISDLLAFFKLMKLLRAINPDIVHTHTSKAGVVGRLASKFACPSAKVIHTYHGHVLYGYFNAFVSKAINILERFLCVFTDVAIAITNPVKVDLISADIGVKTRWEIIHPAIIGPDLRSIPPSSRSSKDCVTLFWIGRFEEIKNPMLAVQALENAISKLPDLKIELSMIGDGTLRHQVLDYAKGNFLPVYFHGWVDDIYPPLASADLLLLTSHNEGLGLVALEAASLGIPTLATKVGGVSDFVRDGDTGFLVDATQFEERLVNLLNNPQNLVQVGLRAKQFLEDEFSFENYLNRHISLYRELANVDK